MKNWKMFKFYKSFTKKAAEYYDRLLLLFISPQNLIAIKMSDIQHSDHMRIGYDGPQLVGEVNLSHAVAQLTPSPEMCQSTGEICHKDIKVIRGIPAKNNYDIGPITHCYSGPDES